MPKTKVERLKHQLGGDKGDSKVDWLQTCFGSGLELENLGPSANPLINVASTLAVTNL